MRNWQLIAIVAIIIVVGLGAWFIYQQSNRTLLSVETPAGSLEVNENSEGVSVEVNGQ